jgi:hypothetical protein
MECQTASLIYTPNKIHKERIWATGSKTADTKTIYNHNKANESKYVEAKQGESFILSISAVNLTDNGIYHVKCGDGLYTAWAELEVNSNSNGE